MFSPYHRGWGPVRYLNGFLASQGGTLNYLSLTCNYAGNLQAQSPSDSDEGTIVNLAPLSYLSKLAFKTHDLKTIQASLVTLSSDSMQELHVEHMPWVGDTYFRCTCEELQELRNLRNIAARRSLSQVAFQFRPGSGTDEQAAFDIFKEQIENGRLEFVDGSTTQPWFQPDTFPALHSRILGRTPTVPYATPHRSDGCERSVEAISDAAARLSV
ncbi:hypothetical protein NMY22_g17593 [Coprinellus aureogranulatus]|nr:hypothetical protein NMY22_g17593 [Coprinellus aureogranulatus]